MSSPTSPAKTKSPAMVLQRKSLKGVPAQEVALGLGGDWFVIRLLSGAVTETMVGQGVYFCLY